MPSAAAASLVRSSGERETGEIAMARFNYFGERRNLTPNSTCRSRLRPVVEEAGAAKARCVVRPSAARVGAS